MASKLIVADILTGNASHLTRKFRNLPLANKLIELEKAVVQPKKSDTPTLLTKVINQLVSQGAIYPDEASAVYSRLLERLVKYNSIRNHNSLDELVQDIQQGQKSALISKLKNVPAMSNMVVLQQFFDSLPKTVANGQQNYDAFKQLLKQFVIDYNNFVEIFRSGTDTFLQYNFGPAVQKINLTQAFKNLHNLWGVRVTTEGSIPSLTALLQPQTRYLILLLSPIAVDAYFVRESFILYLIKLYKNTVVPPLTGEPVEELGNVIASLGPSYDKLKLKQGLNYLVTNQQTQYRPDVPELSKEEEALLRYIQTLLRTKVAGTRRQLTQRDLDNVMQNLNPVAFSGHINFLNRLFDYFRKVLHARPQLMTQIIFDSEWKPPPTFFLKTVLIPQDLELPPTPVQSRASSPVSRLVSDEPDARPIPAPRRPVPVPRTRTVSVPYRLPPPPINTDTDTDTENDNIPPPRPRPKPRKSRVTLDLDNLSTAFSKLRGKGVQDMLVEDFRSKVRNVNIRPY